MWTCAGAERAGGTVRPAPAVSTMNGRGTVGRPGGVAEVGPCARPQRRGSSSHGRAERPHEAAKLYRLGDAHRLRLTLATVRQTVTGPRRPLAHTPFLTARHVWLHTDPAPGPPRPQPTRRPRGVGRAPPWCRRPLRRGRHRRRHPLWARHPRRHRGLVPGTRLRHPSVLGAIQGDDHGPGVAPSTVTTCRSPVGLRRRRHRDEHRVRLPDPTRARRHGGGRDPGPAASSAPAGRSSSHTS